MSFHGSLTDLPIVDVLQLLNATRKTGTLNVSGTSGEASLTLREGLIVSVTHPSKKINIGSVLVGMGTISPGDVEKALALQKSLGDQRKPILAILIESKLIEKNLAFKGLERLIEMSIGEIIKWKEGTFTLDSDSATIHDDFRFSPDQLVSDPSELKVDTQQVLLNALRSLDESDLDTALNGTAEQSGAVSSPLPASSTSPPLTKSEKALRPEEITDQILGLDQVDQLHPFRHEKQVGIPVFKTPLIEKTLCLFSTDFGLQEVLKKHAPNHDFKFLSFSDFRVLTEHLTTNQAHHAHTLVVLDAGPLSQEIDSQHTLDLAKNLLSRFSEVPLAFLYPSDTSSFAATLPTLGSIPALNKPLQFSGDALDDFLDSFFLFIENIKKSPLLQNDPVALSKQISELIGQKNGEDVSGSLLKMLSEVFRRIVLFGVKKDQVLAINILGTSISADDFSMTIAPNSLFFDVMEKRKAYWGTADAFIEKSIFSKLKAPKENSILLLPLRAQSRIVALVYADFGDQDLKAFSTTNLEILGSFAGLLLENSLFEKQIQKFSKT